ncbi:MAG TPA: nucleotide sugar dehydrogenase, partial [Actinomycetota bacterium]|nr:nucleotide sugar dehydrogenase [Actinomycetota bacterium]
RCESPVLEISNDELRRWTESGRFSATDNPDSLAGSDIILICVPTPLADDLPDMRHVEHAAETVARYLKPGQLVVLESTTYPGTTDELLKGILETSGLKAGEDFYLGFSPERIDPGNETYGLHNVPKVIGGFDPGSTTVMEAFYGALVNTVVRVSSTRTAEMVKLLENTYRHVNIALANEMAILCHDLGIDVWEVIEAAATKPFGFQAFWPGPGWGGHCIPVDPSYLSWRVRKMGNTARFVDLAREFNRRMPGYVTLRISEILNEEGKSLRGSNVLILGVAYKPQVADVRESPALTIIEQLQKSGARVEFHDPYVESIRVGGGTKSGSELTAEVLHQADIVVLHTAHPVFDPGWISANSRLILDTRNYLKGMHGLIYRL